MVEGRIQEVNPEAINFIEIKYSMQNHHFLIT